MREIEFNIKYFLSFLVILIFASNSRASNNTVVLNLNTHNIPVANKYLIDSNYTYLDLQKWENDDSRFKTFEYQNRGTRSLKAYWFFTYLINKDTSDFELVIKGKISAAYLDGEPIGTCTSPCKHLFGKMNEEVYHGAYGKVQQGKHGLWVKVSSPNLYLNFIPSLNHYKILDQKLAINAKNKTYIISSFIGFIFIYSIIVFVFYFRLKDLAFLWYGLYLLFIVLHSWRALESEVPHFYSTFNFVPWIYSKLFLFLLIYYSYICFIFNFVSSNIDTDRIDKFLKKLKIFLLIALIPEVFLLVNGYYALSYSYYYYLRVFLMFVSVWLIYLFYKEKQNIIVRFVLAGSSVLVLAEFVSNFISETYDSEVASFGLVLEMIIFSIGLAYRIQLFYKQKLNYEVALQYQLSKIHDLEVDKSSLAMTVLQTRMNPHFIFNSLNSINSFILQSDKKNASYFLSQFSKLIRRILDHSNETQITLAEEITNLRLYIELESLRFKNKFNFKIEIDSALNTEQLLVPPLIFQPFVENAIWHGLLPKNGECKLNLRFIHYQVGFICEIEDNGVGRKTSENLKMSSKHITHKSQGLKITAERLKHFGKSHNKHHSLEIIDKLENSMFNGTLVRVKIW